MSEMQAWTDLEGRVRALETEAAGTHSPTWKDVQALADKLKEADSKIIDLSLAMTRVKQLTRDDIRKMIADAGAEHTEKISRTLQAVFSDEDWRKTVTEQAVEQVRAEIKASIGAAAGSAQSAQAVARANIDASVALLRSGIHYVARG